MDVPRPIFGFCLANSLEPMEVSLAGCYLHVYRGGDSRLLRNIGSYCRKRIACPMRHCRQSRRHLLQSVIIWMLFDFWWGTVNIVEEFTWLFSAILRWSDVFFVIRL